MLGPSQSRTVNDKRPTQGLGTSHVQKQEVSGNMFRLKIVHKVREKQNFRRTELNSSCIIILNAREKSEHAYYFFEAKERIFIWILVFVMFCYLSRKKDEVMNSIGHIRILGIGLVRTCK